MSIGGFYFYPRYCGSVTNWLLACCCHISSISAAFSARFNPFGVACSWNIAPSEYEGDFNFKEDGFTYSDEANMILGFAIF